MLFHEKSIPLHSDKTVGISFLVFPGISRCFGNVNGYIVDIFTT
jgi:hypothetical protein